MDGRTINKNMRIINKKIQNNVYLVWCGGRGGKIGGFWVSENVLVLMLNVEYMCDHFIYFTRNIGIFWC